MTDGLHQKLRHLLLSQGKMRFTLQCPAHFLCIFPFIRLSPKRMNRRPFRYVQHFGLNIGFINILSHFTAQCIDLPHQMPLGAAPDIRVTRHQCHTVHTYGEQDRFKAKAGRRKRRFAACVSRPDDDNVIGFLNMCHFYFPIQNSLNILSARSSSRVSPMIRPSAS